MEIKIAFYFIGPKTPTNEEHETIMLALLISNDSFAFLQNDHTLWLRKLIATFEIKQ